MTTVIQTHHNATGTHLMQEHLNTFITSLHNHPAQQDHYKHEAHGMMKQLGLDIHNAKECALYVDRLSEHHVLRVLHEKLHDTLHPERHKQLHPHQHHQDKHDTIHKELTEQVKDTWVREMMHQQMKAIQRHKGMECW